MKFSLLHPTRSRPEKSFKSTQNWITRAANDDFELIVSIDENDPYKDQYIALYSNVKQANTIVNHNRSAIDAINNAAKESQGEILIVVSDDSDCPKIWDKVITSATNGRTDYVLKVWDGVQKWIVTMPIIDRTYYNRFGYVYHPQYTHMFCDTEFTHVADSTGKVIWRNDIEFKHLHYSVTKEPRDKVAVKNDNTWNEGKSLYLNRFKQNFGIDGVNFWEISNDAHVHWLKQALK